MTSSESMHRFGQTLRELGFLAGRVAQELESQQWSADHDGAPPGYAWPIEKGPLVDYVPEAIEAQPEPEATPPPSKPRPRYPRLVDKTTIDWPTLRLVTASKLSALMREGVYHPRVASDKGYMWLAEQIGSSGSIRDFLTDPSRALNSINFIRLCQWLDEDPAQFIDYHEGV